MSLTFLPKTILELGFQTKEILPFLLSSGEVTLVFLVESGILGFGKRNTAQGTRNPIKDWIDEAIYN